MERRTHFYVSGKNPLTWLMALCMVCSAVARIAFPGVKGSGDVLYVWSQILLPTAAVLLFAAIALLSGRELLYKTAIPVWMLAICAGIRIQNGASGSMMVWLFWIALIGFAAAYTHILSGRLPKGIWLLIPIVLSPMGFLSYFYRDELAAGNYTGMLTALPDLLALFGIFLMTFAIRVHSDGKYHPTWGDRTDGRRLRTLDPMSQISAYVMVHRNESSNLATESVEISAVDRYIRAKRREGLVNFGIMHVLLAAYCRGVAKYPALNRFISGQKVYTHGRNIIFCMTIKKEMTTDSPDTVIKVCLDPGDTAEMVYEKLNAAIDSVKKSAETDTSFDSMVSYFTMIPSVVLKFVVWLLKLLDYFGLIPKALLDLSPFHGSVYFTSMGSLGIPPIYHHLFDFGNLPVFCAFGMKRKALELQEDGSIVQKKYLDLKFTLDERIADGFYYAAFLKYFRRLLAHPEVLDRAPEEILKDID